MTINEEKPLTIAEVISLIGDTEKTSEIKAFLSGYNDMDVETAKKLKQELEGLNILKLKDRDIVKIIDFMPEDVIELNKIVGESNLDSEELTKILNVINK